MNIKCFYFNDLRTCCYILWDESGECVIIDPGCNTENEQGRVTKFVEENHLKPVKLLNTHGHFDHVMGNAFITKKWRVKTYININDIPDLKRSSSYCEYFGYQIESPPAGAEDIIEVNDGDKITFGNSVLDVLFTPGHTRGGVTYVAKDVKMVFTGDSLFAGSIGRTDLPGGDLDQLTDSLNNKILNLPEDYTVYPGHGPATTIGQEKATNPFLIF